MKKLGVGLIILMLFLFGFLSYRWIKHRMEYAITDAVFVRSESMSNVAFEVNGKVVEVYKDVGDHVKKGEPLARIDPENYKLQLNAIEGKLSSLLAQRDGLALQLERAQKQIELKVGISEESLREIESKERAILRQIEELGVQLQQASRDRERMENLLKEGLIPRQKFEQVDTTYKSLMIRKKALEEQLQEVRAVYLKAKKDLEVSKVERKRVEEIRAQLRALDGEIEGLKAQLEKAKLDVEKTKLYSPVEGIVAKRFISVGDTVGVGQPAFSLIEKDSYYIEALLEETKLRGVKVGSKAYVRLDAYPNIVLEGFVEEISPASAATFALVPRDVSAGEFTKVVQRIPVKIKITKGDTKILRVGMGGRVEIKRE
ncbi:MAG: efflux RND transporter periplasmic adaptor subunit [Aquificaceae bacterium]|nr:efflux RND transporter periplasmic adaptor subunit [Aquificaceae bacterium]